MQVENMDIVKKIYNRPTDDQAAVEVIKDCVRRSRENGNMLTPEGIARVAAEQIAAEDKRRDFDTTG